MRYIILLAIQFTFVACPMGKVQERSIENSSNYYSGGDGSSFEEAVTFPAANGSREGVPLERRWLTERYPGYFKGVQRSVTREGRMYDLQNIVTADLRRLVIYFDMTSWFGYPKLDNDSTNK